eukprot:CAMPEP_0181305872 /NCGR_PEP_ID=MMETSP1101-20121128/9977_1 /TAXON_ID=46948 /ORGANISM="Rhodomonas abbreviata, Strain Caron Lab Isolate" /LENGTH=452 /DNA_ID=CAMNT_0023411849 /DNA_START=8 /DNA_END=1366 /DNA_ORIENTATION=+
MRQLPFSMASAVAGLTVGTCAVVMIMAALMNSQHTSVELAAGLSGKAAQTDLNSYFNSMEKQVKSSSELARRHLQRENTMLKSDGEEKQHTRQSLSSSESSSSSSSVQSHRHGLKARVANAKLSGYFNKQALAIKQQAKKHEAMRDENEPSKLSTMAANKDLNSYFDSLSVATTKEGKLDHLSKQVESLSKDFDEIEKPVHALTDEQQATQDTIKTLDRQSEKLLKDSKTRGKQASRAEEAAHRAAESAAAAANAKPASVVVHSVENVVPKHISNPSVKVFGLPPGWKAYMDRRTRYAYFYNHHKDESTWVNPKGSRVSLKGMPYGWEALKEKGDGRVYYVDKTSGQSTWYDPRLKAGAEVLDLLANKDHFRTVETAAKEKTYKLAALRDDHGVYAHNLPRSQWADSKWMRFLSPTNDVGGPMGGMTNDMALRRGLDGETHPEMQRAASSQY